MRISAKVRLTIVATVLCAVISEGAYAQYQNSSIFRRNRETVAENQVAKEPKQQKNKPEKQLREQKVSKPVESRATREPKAVKEPKNKKYNESSASGASMHKSFALWTPFNVVAPLSGGADERMSASIINFLRSRGYNTATSSNKRDSRNIIINNTTKIGGVAEGTSDVYSISVDKDEIVISFTSPIAMQWAMKVFESLYKTKHSVFSKKAYIEGTYIVDNRNPSGDGGSDIISMVNIEPTFTAARAVIDKCKASGLATAYLTFVSPRGFKIDSPVLRMTNPSEELCKNGGGFNYATLKSICDYARNKGVTIVPVLDFVSANNAAFEEFTGHSVHSAEGLRFSMAFMKEFCEKTNFETICLGSIPQDEKVREKYIDPLVSILTKYGIKAVVH